MAQRDTEGVVGVMLAPTDQDASTYRRVGYVNFEPRKHNLFENIDKQTITIVYFHDSRRCSTQPTLVSPYRLFAKCWIHPVT